MTEHTYTIFAELNEAGTGWGAWVSDLGVFVTADTREEAIAEAKTGIDVNLQARRDFGKPIPEPSAAAEQFTVAIAA
jgi:predicted RNase H-like HicB family nuclease